MVIPNCRRCFSSLLLIILLLKSTQADDLLKSLNSNATVPLENLSNRTTTIVVDERPINNDGDVRQNVNIVSDIEHDRINGLGEGSMAAAAATAEKNVQIKLSDLQQMLYEYLDDNLPPADNAIETEQQNGAMQRGFSQNQLFNRLRKFAERYIHPDISKAVTSTGRVFLLKGRRNINL